MRKTRMRKRRTLRHTTPMTAERATATPASAWIVYVITRRIHVGESRRRHAGNPDDRQRQGEPRVKRTIANQGNPARNPRHPSDLIVIIAPHLACLPEYRAYGRAGTRPPPRRRLKVVDHLAARINYPIAPTIGVLEHVGDHVRDAVQRSSAIEDPIRLRREMSVGSIPKSRQSGFQTFMGVSTNTLGFNVAKENSQAIDDQSVISTSES